MDNANAHPRRYVIAGGSGQIGALLGKHWRRQGADVLVLTRNPRHDIEVGWDGQSLGAWVSVLEGADVLVNLAGRSVNCRYTKANRRQIMDSRVQSTKALGQAVQQCKRPPKVWLQSSTATIYPHTFEDGFTEDFAVPEPSGEHPWDFSVQVAKAWEKTALEYRCEQTRLVLLRSAMVMSPGQDGVFETLLSLVRVGLGGTAGSGKQYMSWIHGDDFVAAMDFIVDDPDWSGATNICSPNPIPNREFMAKLRHAWGSKIGLPASEWMLKVGTWWMRTETELVLKSRRVLPGRLMNAGFRFRYPIWDSASIQLCAVVRGRG